MDRVQLVDLFQASDLLVAPGQFRTWLATAETQFAAIDQGEIRAALGAYETRRVRPQVIADAAVIDICGLLLPKSSWVGQVLGWTNMDDLQACLDLALGDPAIRTIVLRVDSPGGAVTLVPEVADAIYAARSQKPVVAIADTLAASAAYWLASQASAIYASPSSQLGSIGVYVEHTDISGNLANQGIAVTFMSYGRHKMDGNPYEPLSDAVRARFQARVDALGLEFERAVARGRGVTLRTVQETFGQGDLFRGREAISRRLADRTGTFGQAIGRLADTAASRHSAREFHAAVFGDDAVAAEHEAILAVLLAQD